MSYTRLSHIRYRLHAHAVLYMTSKYEERIYKMLSDEPVTPNEIALRIKVSHKTAQRILMHLALTRGDIKYKNSGRIHLFWKSRG